LRTVQRCVKDALKGYKIDILREQPTKQPSKTLKAKAL